MSPLRRTPLKRGKPLNRVNRKRRQSEFARTYHSKERVEFVKALPCIVCGHGPCDNAHIETGGMGRKADYTKIVPLCSMPMDHPWSPGYPKGHHGEFHRVGRDSFVKSYVHHSIDLEKAAAETERLWLQRQEDDAA